MPLHYQIQRLLRAKIVAQEWAAGDRIPTELELARSYGVSRATIRQALRPLVADRLLVRHRAKGTFVPADDQSSRGHKIVFANQLLGYQADSRFIHAETVHASILVAGALEVERFAPLRRFVRVETLDGEPVAVVINFVKPHLARHVRKSDLQRHSMIECLRRRAGVRIGRGDISVSATMPDAEVASLLGSDVTHPVLCVLVIARDEEGQTLQTAYGYYRSERVRFEQTIEGADIGFGSVFETSRGGRLTVTRAVDRGPGFSVRPRPPAGKGGPP